MNLGELLEELRGNLLRDVSDLKIGRYDKFWTDETLVRYINDAHQRFARLSLCIHDSNYNSPACQVTLQSGVEADGITPIVGGDTYTLHKSVLSVLSARHQDVGQDMVRLTRETGITISNEFTETFQLNTLTTIGMPTAFSTDEGMDPTRNFAIRMRFFGIPNATQIGKIVYMRVIRVPLKKLTFDDLECSHEVPEEYELDMIEWAAWRALRNWDIDSEDRTKAQSHADRFMEAVKECRRDIIRKTFPALHWTFGQNAFSGYVKN